MYPGYHDTVQLRSDIFSSKVHLTEEVNLFLKSLAAYIHPIKSKVHEIFSTFIVGVTENTVFGTQLWSFNIIWIQQYFMHLSNLESLDVDIYLLIILQTHVNDWYNKIFWKYVYFLYRCQNTFLFLKLI